MKSIVLTFIVTLLLLRGFSQEKDSLINIPSPSGKLSGLIDIQDLGIDGNTFGIDDFEGHWSGIEIGINGFANANYNLYPSGEENFLKNDLLRSNTLGLNLIQYSKGLQQVRNNFGLISGLGLSFKSYHLDTNTSISKDNNNVIQPSKLYYETNQKSKFSLLYLDIPLLLELQIPINNINNRFNIAAGLIGSKRLESHTKIKYRRNGKKEKLKSPDDYSTNDYKITASIRVGYHSLNFFVNYDLVPLFEKDKGPVLYPFSAGIKLISF